MAVVLRELPPLPLPVGACTNLDFNFDAVHRVVFEDWWDAHRAFDPRRHWGGVRVRIGLFLSTPLWLILPSNPIVACFPIARLVPLLGRHGASRMVGMWGH